MTANSILTEYTNLFVSDALTIILSMWQFPAQFAYSHMSAALSFPVCWQPVLQAVEIYVVQDFWYDDNWQDFRHCGPTPACPTCPYVPGTDHGSCSRFPNGTKNPAVPPSPGGFITNVDAMVALTKPEYSGNSSGTWADGDMLMVCNYGGGGANAGGRGDG